MSICEFTPAMQHIKGKRVQRLRRAKRTRTRVRGTSEMPRLSVFRSNRHLSAELIDDRADVTVASASDLGLRARKSKPLGRRERAEQVGLRLAQQAQAKNIRAARFDRGRYRYHGLVAAVAAGARKGGLHF